MLVVVHVVKLFSKFERTWLFVTVIWLIYPVLSQINSPVYELLFSLKIGFNIILPSLSRFRK
jgi:hypothetical protein